MICACAGMEAGGACQLIGRLSGQDAVEPISMRRRNGKMQLSVAARPGVHFAGGGARGIRGDCRRWCAVVAGCSTASCASWARRARVALGSGAAERGGSCAGVRQGWLWARAAVRGHVRACACASLQDGVRAGWDARAFASGRMRVRGSSVVLGR